MAIVSITIPNGVVARVQGAFGAAYGYQATIGGAPNPETLTNFTQRKVREFIVGIVVSQEAVAAAETARVAAIAQANTDIVLT